MEDPEQPLTLEETLSRLEAEQRSESATARAADYLLAASLLDEEQDLLTEVRARLQREDPRALCLAFIKENMQLLQTKSNGEKYQIARQLNDVAIMGLGFWQEDLGIVSEGQGSLRINNTPDWGYIQEHLNRTVFGKYFVEEIQVPADTALWSAGFPLRLSACDASQHRLKLRVPFNHTWATPVLVNNAAGTIKERVGRKAQWRNLVVPRDTRDYEDWVILGPDDYAEMDEGDYEWAARSAMDVGEFYVEETHIFKHAGLTQPPDVHFRDGRIFPQDHLMNARLTNRHGQLTREAIYRMTTACRTARELNIMFCGVAKQVQLKVYATLINWYITRAMNKPNWNPTGKIVSDSEIVRQLLPNPAFRATTFDRIYVICPILREFATASNLNRRTRQQVQLDLDGLSRVYHNRNLTAREIVEEALKIQVIMFFAGHTTTNEAYIPRYELAVGSTVQQPQVSTMVYKLLSALRLASFDVDEDHLWGLEEPIVTMVPTPLLVAHDLSKKLGEELAARFAQRAVGEFVRRLKERSTDAK